MPIQINNVPRRVVYAASGTGPYNFTFEILTASDISVYRDNTLLTLTTNYTVTINANGTGYVTLTATPTGATQIAIVGNRTIQRLTDFVTGGDFFANTLNDELDQQTIFAQQNAEGIARALQAPVSDPASINMTLPAAATRASKYLGFDASGNPAALTGTGSYSVINLAADVTGTLAVANGGTGITSFGTGVATALGQNVTGSGGIVLATSPTLVTPTLGAASATSVALAAGAAGTPSLTATGDTDTGLWFPAANTLAASTGGTERLRIDSSGNVGVGTASPTDNLDVVGTETASNVSIFARNLATTTNSNSRLGLRGNNDAVRATFLLDGLGTIFNTGGILYTETNHPLLFGTNSVERMRITSGGDVGIGTTTPAGKLVVSANGATIVVSAADNATATSASYQLTNSAGTIVGRTIYYGPSYSGGSLFSVGANGIAITQEANAPFAIGTYAVSQPLIFATSSNEQMRVTSGGDVGIGTTSPASKLSVFKTSSVQIQASTANIDFRVQCIDANSAAYVGSITNHALVFTTNNSERMRITSGGELLKGVTTYTYGSTADGFQVSSGQIVVMSKASTADVNQIVFNNGNGQVGYINTNGTGTTYSTVSDYRLKENVRPMTGALSKIAALKPVTYTWKTDGSNGQGFIAHELQEVVPECVSGQKDAVDENGNPRYQGVDASFLVATLTAAIQEQQAIIKSLTDRIAALEAKRA